MNAPTLETPLIDLVDNYLNVRNPGGKPDTNRLHRQAIRRLEETLGHPPTIGDLTDENLGLHAQKRLSAGRARDTVAGEQKKLLAQWRFYARRGYTKVRPECKPISGVKRTPKAWTKAEFDKLYEKCELAAAVDDTPGVIWWRCLLSCLFFSGERIGAMMELKWSGVDFEGGWLELPAEVRKNSAIDRRYKIPPETVDLLRKMPKDKAGPFDCEICLSTLYNRFKGLLKRAELPLDRRSMFHRIRRTTASHYAAAGGNAQHLLGHSSPAVTERYIDPAIAPQPQAVDLLIDPETDETVTLGEKKRPGLFQRLRTAIGRCKMKFWPFSKKQTSPETLRELIDEYHAGKSLAYDTLRKHLHDHSRFEVFLRREPLVSDLTDKNIASYFRGRLVEGRAIRTAECEMIDLRTFWYFAHKKGYLATKPGPRPVKIPDPRTKYVNLEVSQDEDIRQCDFL